MRNITKINLRALSQFLLVIAVVFAIGLYMKGRNNHPERESKNDSGLPSELTLSRNLN